MAYRKSPILIAALGLLAACGSGWKQDSKADEMSGKTSYALIRESSTSMKYRKETYTPSLAVQFKDNEVRTYINAKAPINCRYGHGAYSADIPLRFDDEQPTSWSATCDEEKRRFIFDNARDLAIRFLKAKSVKAQYPLLDARDTVATFPLDGLQQALEKLCTAQDALCRKEINPDAFAIFRAAGVEIKGGEMPRVLNR